MGFLDPTRCTWGRLRWRRRAGLPVSVLMFAQPKEPRGSYSSLPSKECLEPSENCLEGKREVLVGFFPKKETAGWAL